MKHINTIYISILIFLLTSCATIQIEKDQADLMPESVAISIFKKNGFGDWVKKPYVLNPVFHKEKEYIQFNQIDRARYLPLGKRFTFFIPWPNHIYPMFIFFNNITEQQAIELTNAARALGATKIEKLDVVY
jgi:hypothetical protein